MVSIFVSTGLCYTPLANFGLYLCLLVKFHKSSFWVPILAAEGPYWVPISWKVGVLVSKPGGPYKFGEQWWDESFQEELLVSFNSTIHLSNIWINNILLPQQPICWVLPVKARHQLCLHSGIKLLQWQLLAGENFFLYIISVFPVEFCRGYLLLSLHYAMSGSALRI